MSKQRLFSQMLGAAALIVASAGIGFASTTITGTVETTGKYLVSGAPATTSTASVLKLSFENTTAGTGADFAAGTCATRLSDSGGPGFVFLTIVDTPAISGKFIYVIRAVGIAPSTFRLTIE